MQLILAIDSDPRRSEQLAALVRAKLTVDLVQARSAGEGLHALRDRVPDLILMSPLLSPFDDGVLDEYLRDLGSAATHVQTVRIPMLSAAPKKMSAARSLFSLGRTKKQTSSAAPDGCDPKVFADEIAHYLTRSLEERSASATMAAHRTPGIDRATVAQDTDRWSAPQTQVEEFRIPVYEPLPPIDAEPEPAYVYTYPVEETQPVRQPEPVASAPVFEEMEETSMPGSILHLQSAIVRVPEPPLVVEPRPPVVQYATMAPEPRGFVEREPVFFEPEPVFAPEPVFVERQPVVFAEPEPLAVAAPEPTVFPEPEPPVCIQPEPTATVRSIVTNASQALRPQPPAAAPATTTSSFEAALAAIRAAWVKPEDRKSEAAVAASPEPASVSPQVRSAGSGEVDLTGEIDALEDIGSVDGTEPSADEDPSPGESKTPNARRNGQKPAKRPEKPRARKTQGAEDGDEWGVFDPNQYEFSALVNKLDEVTESDEVTTPRTNVR